MPALAASNLGLTTLVQKSMTFLVRTDIDVDHALGGEGHTRMMVMPAVTAAAEIRKLRRFNRVLPLGRPRPARACADDGVHALRTGSSCAPSSQPQTPWDPSPMRKAERQSQSCVGICQRA